ncbi:MAG: hypothetical protein OK457_05410 [Thaumarchaeota archaeon]|nr:hypothetical protein [Nitrososphaerota archaeon]
MSDYRLTADICTCEICQDTWATICQSMHHMCCFEQDRVYLDALANDEMLD